MPQTCPTAPCAMMAIAIRFQIIAKMEFVAEVGRVLYRFESPTYAVLGNPCLSNPCTAGHGTCVPSSSTLYTCMCHTGWMGLACEIGSLVNRPLVCYFECLHSFTLPRSTRHHGLFGSRECMQDGWRSKWAMFRFASTFDWYLVTREMVCAGYACICGSNYTPLSGTCIGRKHSLCLQFPID